MDYYFIDQQKAPIYNNYNAKSQKQIDINQSNNNYTSRINHKNVKPYRKEALSGEKIQTKKYKTSKNSPVKNLPETYREYSKENKHPLKMSQNNEIIKNTKNHTEIFDICFIKRMKGIYPKKSNQPIYRPNSNSLLMNQYNNKNYTDRLMGNTNNNSKYKKYAMSMNNSGIIKGKKTNYNINQNANSNFYYNNDLYNYYNNMNSFEENENKNNYSNNNNNVYCSINVSKKGINSYGHMNNSSSMKMLFNKKAYNNYMNNNNYNKNINNNYDNLDINLENESKMNNNSSNKYIETYNNKNRFQSNCTLVKNSQKLVKNYVNNSNNNSFRPSFNHNYNNYNNSNFNLNEKLMNKVHSHQRMKSNEDSSLMLNGQKDRNVSAINYLQNSMKFKKDYPKYMLKYTNNNQNNNSGTNKKIINMIDSYDINSLSNDISGINKTSRLNSNNNNKLEEEIYMNNDLANLELDPFPNHQKIINYPIESIEKYINMNQVNKMIKNISNKEIKKDKSNNNIINRNIYINNNFNSSVKLKTKQNTHNNTANNSEHKIKIKKQNMSSKMNKDNNQQIKGYTQKNNNNNNMLRSSSSNLQKTTQFSSSNNIHNCDKIKSSKNSMQNNNNNLNILDTNSNISNFNNINYISVSQSNNINTIYDKKNFTANNFMIKNYKSKDQDKDKQNNKEKNKYNKNSLSNKASSNKIVNYSNNNSTNNLDFEKEVVYQKKISQKDYRTTFNSLNNSKSKSKIDDYLNSHKNNSSIKTESIKSRLIKTNIPMTNLNSPSDKKNKNYYYIISNNDNINNIKNSRLYNLNNYLDNKKNADNNENNKKIKEEIIRNNEKLEDKKSSTKIIKNDYYKDKEINENYKNDYLKENKVINNNDKNNQTNKNDLNSEVTSSCKTNEFENRNMSEFPVNDNIIKSKVEEHNNLYMNKNNIMALNEKNNENFEKLKKSYNFKISPNLMNIINSKDDTNKEKDTERDEINYSKQSKQSIQTKETKEIFKSIHDSDTLIDKDKNLSQLHQLNPEISHSKTKIEKKNNIPFDKSKIVSKEIKVNTIKNIDINSINNLDIDRNLIKKEKEKEEKIIFDNNKETLSKEKIIFNNNEMNSEKGNNEENDNESKETKNKDNNGIIDLKFLQNNIFKEEDKKEKNNITKDNKEDNSIKDSKANIDDPLANKNQREINKLNQKKSSKEKNYELIKNMYKNDMLCEPINANNPKGSINNLSKHIFTTSITKDCDYYQNEQEKLSAYIKNYYQENKIYPKSNINFYLYGRQIGHGAFGQVNLALHIASGRLVAIKIFNKKNLKNTRAKQKIKNEVEMLSHFHHPFINQILDNFETDTHIFIVMEYVCGDLLGFIRKRGKLSESVSKLIFKQLIEGLKYIHRKKVVHRDIKLDNILIDLTNTIKICDFGVSRKFTDKDELMNEHCGTPAYIAPEIFENHGYKGTACDIWSAGVTLYYMLGGVQPFKANSILELEKIIMSGEYKELEDVSKEANKLIKGMLQVNPKKRFGVDDILGHPWLDKVDLNQRQKLNLFTEAEKILMSKFDVDYLNSDKSELIENFTMKNLDSDKISKNNGNTKSLIFAPYNSYIENENNEELSFEEDKDYKDLKVLNDICKFGWRVQQANIQYELSNNGDFDNGLIKTQKEEDFKKENEKIEKVIENKSKNEKKWVNSPRGSDSEDEADVIQINQDIVDKIEKEVGYNKSYIIECLNKNKINYATATYYLLARENLYNYQPNCTKDISK